MYSALELARAARYTVRPMPTGGVRLRENVLEIGPDARDHEIIAYANKRIVVPAELLMPSVKRTVPTRRRLFLSFTAES